MNKVTIKEKEIEKIGFDHDRDKVYNTTNKKMTNEKKAMIGSIVSIILIIISFSIRPIGEFFIKLVLGTFILAAAILLIGITYNAIYQGILDLLEMIDEHKRDK